MATSQPGEKIGRGSTRWMKMGLRLFLGALIVALVGTLGYLIYAGFTYGWPAWTGFGEYIPPPPKIEGYQRAKTLWDWLQLLIVSVVLFIIGYLVNRAQQMRTETGARQRDETERKIAEQRTRDGALETYLDHITELMINKKLLKSKPDDEIRDIAYIRTMTALRRLDSERNRILIQFLHDAGLLSGESASIIKLSNLHGADLQGVNLEGANLRDANLERADLYGATLQGAHLEGANLRDANLEMADLQGAYLEGADLRGANLHWAILHKAALQGVNLEGANLECAALREANLQGANLYVANLYVANLYGANLEGAKLQGANLKGASLYETNVYGPQLQGATMPDGTKYK